MQKVASFKEKPNLETAQNYLAQGNIYGMPVYSSGMWIPYWVLLNQMRQRFLEYWA